MKRFLTFCLALILMLSLAACGGDGKADISEKNTDPGKEPVVLNMPEVYQKLQQKVALPEMQELNENMMLDLCGIEAANVKQAIVVICADSLRTDEIWLIEATNADAAQQIKGLADARLAQKDAESITYSPEQNAVVKKAELIVTGNYVALFVSPDSQALAEVFRAEAQ